METPTGDAAFFAFDYLEGKVSVAISEDAFEQDGQHQHFDATMGTATIEPTEDGDRRARLGRVASARGGGTYCGRGEAPRAGGPGRRGGFLAPPATSDERFFFFRR